MDCEPLGSQKTLTNSFVDLIIRQIQIEDGKVKYNVKMVNKWRDVPIHGSATPFIRHSHVVFDVLVLNQNLSINWQ